MKQKNKPSPVILVGLSVNKVYNLKLRIYVLGNGNRYKSNSKIM